MYKLTATQTGISVGLRHSTTCSSVNLEVPINLSVIGGDPSGGPSDFLIPPSTLINPHSIYTAITGRELTHFQRTYVPIRHFRGSVSIVLSTIETKSARCVSCDHTDHTKSELTHIGNISYEISDDISPDCSPHEM